MKKGKDREEESGWEIWFGFVCRGNLPRKIDVRIISAGALCFSIAATVIFR
jgi:hypothetical protein